MSEAWKRELAERLAEPAAVVGIGRAGSGDDGVGPEVVRLLRGRTRAALFDCGAVPENFIGPIARAKPKCIVLIDAAAVGAEPGAVALYALSSLREATFHTHAASPALFLDVLVARINGSGTRDGVKGPGPVYSFMIGIQPKTAGFGEAMSPEVLAAARDVAEAIAAALPLIKETP